VLGVNSFFWSSTKSMKISGCELLNEQNIQDIVHVSGKFSYPTNGQSPVLSDDTGSVSVELLNLPFASSNTEVECLGKWQRSGTNNLLRAAIWRELPNGSGNQTAGLPVLTTAAQVQQLTRAEASRRYPVKIRGVVTFVSPQQHAIAIQDSTRGVSIVPPPNWTGSPLKVGEKIEVEGNSDAGNFAPVVLVNKWGKIGAGVLPDPQRPSYDQLIRGSMTSQYVEIQGYVTEARDHHLTLLMPGGKIDVEFGSNPVEALDSFVNAVVRIRGCMFAKWDAATLLVTPTHPLWFGNATICEDIPPPKDIFDARKMRSRELLQFDALGNFFQRVKVSGQVLAGDEKKYYCTDGDFGFRFELAKSEKLNPGDDVEVVGLVDLGGASPTLREAVIRITGHSPLPKPQPLALKNPNAVRDTTRVWVDGLLLDDKDNGTERVLQMQGEGGVFSAQLRGKDRLTGQWQIGSRMRMTGVFVSSEGGGNEVLTAPFELVVNSPADVMVLTWPPWWTLNRLLTMAGMLTVGLILAFIWNHLLRHQVKRRTAQLKHEITERQRVEQIRAIEQERARIAQDLHDDLGSRVTVISMLARAGTEKNLEQSARNEKFSLILDRSRLLVAALDGLVWAANPKYDTVAALVEYLAAFTEELLTETGIARRIEIPARISEQRIPAEIRHNVLLSVKEVLNNAIRHGRPTEVLLQIIISEGEVEILIRDNGCGFDLAQHNPGEGLANLRRRVSKINGHCRIQPEMGKGTSIFLTFPV
jgi:signal transduction histidine kinase